MDKNDKRSVKSVFDDLDGLEETPCKLHRVDSPVVGSSVACSGNVVLFGVCCLVCVACCVLFVVCCVLCVVCCEL